MSTAVAPSASFLIDQILPTRTIHLVSGPSGIGKTTYLFQLLNDWHAGHKVLEHDSHPVPFCYITCSRGRDEASGAIARLDLKLPSESLLSMPRDRTLPEDVSLEASLKLARNRIPNLRLLILDGIGILCRGRITEYSVVADFMRKTHDICTHENLTIIGLGPHSKTDSEGPPRSRFLGSVAWGEYASTMIVIEGQQDSEDRTVRILPVGASQETWSYQLGPDGRFILTTDDSVAFGLLDRRVGDLQPGVEFETKTALEWAREASVSRQTAERWLKKRVEDGALEKPRRGVYKLKFLV